jgi:hypothetical protein
MNEQQAAITLIANERSRQMTQEGYSTEHDDTHQCGELAIAAGAYVRASVLQSRGKPLAMIQSAVPAGAIPFPWEDNYWKPSDDQIRNLVKAGALIVAEIQRLQRIKP